MVRAHCAEATSSGDWDPWDDIIPPCPPPAPPPPTIQEGTEVTVRGQERNPINGLRAVVVGRTGDVNQYWVVSLTNGCTAHLLPTSLTASTPGSR